MNDDTVGVGRRALALAGLVCGLVVVSWLLLHYGQQHRIIIDNRSVELPDGKSLGALAGALVAVNHATLNRDEVSETAKPPSERPIISFKFWPSPDPSIAEAVEMAPRERILAKVLGPSFNLKFEAFDRRGNSQGTFERTVHLGTRRDAMVRLVKIKNDLPDFLEPYPTEAGPRPPAEEEAAPVHPDEAQPPGSGFGGMEG